MSDDFLNDPALLQDFLVESEELLQGMDQDMVTLESAPNDADLNLLDDARMLFMKGMDLIFCANVLIYFDLNSKRRVIQHFYSNLQTHGYFFLGHSESLYGVSELFKLVHFPSATGYVKSQPAAGGR